MLRFFLYLPPAIFSLFKSNLGLDFLFAGFPQAAKMLFQLKCVLIIRQTFCEIDWLHISFFFCLDHAQKVRVAVFGYKSFLKTNNCSEILENRGERTDSAENSWLQNGYES